MALAEPKRIATQRAPEERRTHPRVHVAAEVEISGPDGPYPARLKDLSRGGACIRTDQEIANSGETILLFVPFANGEQIGVMAEVVRVVQTLGQFEYGLHFSVIEPGLENKLVQLIDLLL